MSEALTQNVRELLRFIGAKVAERPTPEVFFGAEKSCYSPGEHAVYIAANAHSTVLAHEFAHSQQADLSPAGYYGPAGQINAGAWMAEPRELEAMAVEKMVPWVSHPSWGFACESIISAGIVGCERADWIKWLFCGSPASAKPHHLSRTPRRAMNSAMRIVQNCTKSEA